jgi:hypothetical protein
MAARPTDPPIDSKEARIMRGSRAGPFFAGAALATALVASLAPSPVRAATLVGVELPDQATVGGKILDLNGLGLRTATFLKVKVYVIGLYLERKSRDADAIIESHESKRIQMHFVRNVSAETGRDAIMKGFKNNTEDLTSISDEIASFDADVRDMRTGDTMVLDFSGDTVDVVINGIKVDSVRGRPFQRALLGIWLGAKPIDKDLKQGILGR